MLEFVYNLYYVTVKDEFVKTLDPGIYIKSPGKVAQSLEQAITSFNENGIGIMADNCCFPVIKIIAEKYKALKCEIADAIKKEEKQQKKALCYSDLSLKTCGDIDNFVDQAVTEALKRIFDDAELLDEQLKMKPTMLIGAEDITIPLLMEMNLEPHYTGVGRKQLKLSNKEVLRRAKKVMKGLDEQLQGSYYPVPSFACYDTAYDAGLAFAGVKMPAVAFPVGAFMSDTGYEETLTISGREYKLPEALPQSIIRSAVIIKGFIDGYTKKLGAPPEKVHLLGFGNLMMVLTVMPALKGVKHVTFDATSAIYDANGGIFYVTKPSYLKLKSHKMALRLASHDDAAWECPCPFCHSFMEKHPFDYERGRQLWENSGLADLTPEDLKPGGFLNECYPLLGESKDRVLRDDIVLARVGHNHWMVEEALKEINSFLEDEEGFDQSVEKLIDIYAENTINEKYSRAYKLAFRLITAPDIKSMKAVLT